MNTDQLLTVTFSEGSISIYHKSMMGSLTDLFNVGNRYRVSAGKGTANMSLFLQSAATQEFISIICKRQGCSPDDVIRQSGRGKSSKTMANLHLIIYAAEYLSTEFHYEVIDAFITNKLLEWRDDSGDEFKLLNLAIDNYLPERDGKDNKWIYINIAKAIKLKVNPDGNMWNTATALQLRQRAKIEARMVSVLELGLIRNWEHLKEIIEKL